MEKVKSTPSEPQYLTLLRQEFVRRKQKNAGYSLSAFAKSLVVDQSLFSKILSGKRKISPQLAKNLLLKCGYPLEKAVASAFDIPIKTTHFNFIEEDQFSFLSDWIPFAILELAKTKKFNSEPAAIAKRLNIHKTEALSALQKLQAFGYISIDLQTKKLTLKKPNNNWANTAQTSAARKLLQKKFTEMSAKAIDEVPFEQREHGSLTLAINKKQIPKLKELMNDFRMELGRLAQESDDLDEVYQITTALFPLSNSKSGEIT